MYNLPCFNEKDPAVVLQFLRHHPFAFLCGCDVGNKPVATQVPLLVEEREGKLFLRGHIQRETDHHLAFEHNPHVLALFTGAHSYVSASWYTDKTTASTWNYMTVHAKGIIRFLDEHALLQLLTKLTAHFENDPASPSLVEKMDKGYVDKMMKAIVAFEIEITGTDNVFKLSQNRDRESYHNIIPQLEAQGGGAAVIAAEMEKRSGDLFGE
jgi:transcriptional regulator